MAVTAPEPENVGAVVQRAALVGLLTSVALVASGMIRTKVIAVTLGPAGNGAFAEVSQTVLLFTPALDAVTGGALVGALGRGRQSGSEQDSYDAAATLVLGLGAVVTVLAIGWGTIYLHDAPLRYLAYVALFAVGSVATYAVNLPNAALQARKDVRRYGIATAVMSLVAATGAAIGTAIAGLPGLFLAGTLVPLLLLGAFSGLWRDGLAGLRLRPRPSFRAAFLRDIASVGAASFIAMFAGQAAMAGIVWSLGRYGGETSVGQFAAASSIGIKYFEVILRAISVGVAVRYASATREELKSEVEAGTKLVFDAAPPLVLFAIAVREPVMYLLNSHEYGTAAHIVGFQMAADLARGLSYVYATVLLFRGEVRAFLVTEVTGALTLAALGAALIPLYGEAGASYAYALNYCLYVVLTAVVVHRTCGIPLHPRRLAAALAFTAVATAIVVACTRWPTLRIPLAIVGVGWGLQTDMARTVLAAIRRRLDRLRGGRAPDGPPPGPGGTGGSTDPRSP